jgi:hypothetical protein
MEPISFVDMYGLALIAKTPHVGKRAEIFNDLSPEAQRLAKEIITPAKTHPEHNATNEGPGKPALTVVPSSDK